MRWRSRRDTSCGLAGRENLPAGHDLREEAEPGVPVRTPAVGAQAEAVGAHERRVAAVLREVVATGEGLEVHLDADPAQRGLEGLGGRLLLGPALAVAHVRLEAIRLTALLQVLLRLG